MLELLSLTCDNDLALAKIDDYYLCLAEPSKRKYGLNWNKANKYCKSLGEDYSLPTKDELNLIYLIKEDLCLVEICLYGNEINTLDFISKRFEKDHPQNHSYVWSSSEYSDLYAWGQFFNSGNQYDNYKGYTNLWVLPVRRVLV